MNIENHIREIETYGYTIIRNGNPNFKEHLKLIKSFESISTKENKALHDERASDGVIYNLQNLDISFVNLLREPAVVEIVKKLLNDEYYQVMDSSNPNYILNYFNARSSGKFLDLHIDSYVPSPGDYTWVMQVAYVLEDMNEDNGCTVVVPGSHRSGRYTDRLLEKRVPLIAKAGDIALWDSRLWHGTLDNLSGNSRWVLIATFTRWWIKQTMDITRSLPNEIYLKLTNEEKLMLGFCSIPPTSEFGSIHTKKNYEHLKENVSDYYS